MPNIVVLNGPPNSGKDAIASRMHTHCTLSFKKPMFDIALTLTGLSRAEWFERYNNRDLKEKPWDRIGGMSCRQLMIMVSEDVMKPIRGKGVFGHMLAEQIKPGLSYVISDGGFIDELVPLTELTTHRVHLIHLHRAGCTFEGDSRDYIRTDICRTHTVWNAEGRLHTTVLSINEYIRQG